jgi:outer membrane protein OmpA-like peptidoglycan-associated protein
MQKKTFWTIVAITILGANVIIFYYNIKYLKAPAGPQPHESKEQPAKEQPSKEQPTPAPDVTPKGQQDGKPDEEQNRPASGTLTVRFEHGTSKLSRQALEDLAILSKMVAENPNLKVSVSGYTDSVGDPFKNLQLSAERAKIVGDILIKLHIPAERLEIHGYGSQDPVADNGTEEGRAQNRRVVVTVTNG